MRHDTPPSVFDRPTGRESWSKHAAHPAGRLQAQAPRLSCVSFAAAVADRRAASRPGNHAAARRAAREGRRGDRPPDWLVSGAPAASSAARRSKRKPAVSVALSGCGSDVWLRCPQRRHPTDAFDDRRCNVSALRLHVEANAVVIPEMDVDRCSLLGDPRCRGSSLCREKFDELPDPRSVGRPMPVAVGECVVECRHQLSVRSGARHYSSIGNTVQCRRPQWNAGTLTSGRAAVWPLC